MWGVTALAGSALILNLINSEKPEIQVQIPKGYPISNTPLVLPASTDCIGKPMLRYAGTTGVCNDVIHRLPVQKGVASW